MKHINAKFKATLIHTLLSLIAFSIVLYYMLTQWFPNPFFAAEGGWQALKIVLFVDIVLGPFLTFLVFSPLKSKKAICFDLTCIAIVQVIAFSWGVKQAYNAQVIGISYLVHNKTFYPIKLIDAKKQDLNPDVFFDLDKQNTPSVLYSTRPPEGDYDANTESIIATYHGIQEHTQLKLLSSFQQAPIDIDNLAINGTPQEKEAIKIWNQKTTDKFIFARYKGSFSIGILVFNENLKPVDFIELKNNQK